MELLQPKKPIRIVGFSFFLLCISGCNKPGIDNYFLPKDFEGNVAIIYTGQVKPSKGVHNYNVPWDGILRSEETFQEGDFEIFFHQKNDRGTYDTLHEASPSDTTQNEDNKIYFNRVLTFSKGGEKYEVVSFLVSKRIDSGQLQQKIMFERKLEHLLLDK